MQTSNLAVAIRIIAFWDYYLQYFCILFGAILCIDTTVPCAMNHSLCTDEYNSAEHPMFCQLTHIHNDRYSKDTNRQKELKVVRGGQQT